MTEHIYFYESYNCLRGEDRFELPSVWVQYDLPQKR